MVDRSTPPMFCFNGNGVNPVSHHHSTAYVLRASVMTSRLAGRISTEGERGAQEPALDRLARGGMIPGS